MLHIPKRIDQNFTIPDFKAGDDTDFFQMYGICGTCELVGRRGLVAISDFRLNDEVITRKGLTSVTAVMRQKLDSKPVPSQTVIALEQDCLGRGLPDRNIVVGGGATARRYVRSNSDDRSECIGVESGSSAYGSRLQDCENGELYVIVLPVRTEVLVHGIYVMCPGVSDIKGWFHDRCSNSTSC